MSASPDQLLAGPFAQAVARSNGVSARMLMGKRFEYEGIPDGGDPVTEQTSDR